MHSCSICTGSGLTPTTSEPGLDSPRRHLHRDWAQPAHICTALRGTEETTQRACARAHTCARARRSPRLRRHRRAGIGPRATRRTAAAATSTGLCNKGKAQRCNMTEDRTGGSSLRVTAAWGCTQSRCRCGGVRESSCGAQLLGGREREEHAVERGGRAVRLRDRRQSFHAPRSDRLSRLRSSTGPCAAAAALQLQRLYSTWDVISATQETGEAAGIFVDPLREVGLERESRGPELSATFAGSGGVGLQTLGLAGIRHAAARALMYRCPSAFLPNRCDRRFI